MEKYLLFTLLVMLALYLSDSAAVSATSELEFKEDYLRRLVKAVPHILESQNPKTGRFGTGIWMVNDQHSIYPLAAVWSSKSPDNPYFHDQKVLEAVMKGGDALIDDQDETGQWEFRKKDGSTWGKIYMPWTYSRWIRAYAMIKDAMPADRRKRWEDALTLGYTGISKTCLDHIHNIPAHHAMGLFIAGQALDKPEWCEQASEFLHRVIEKQSESGFWSENHGPVVMYNGVYTDAIGVYYAISKDPKALPALQRAAVFHANFTYPDGSAVETVDERNPYHAGVTLGTVGMTFSPEGRGFVLRQFGTAGPDRRHDPDGLATFFLYGEEGPTVPPAAEEKDHTFLTADNKAMVRRKGPWFVCMSSYRCPVPKSRWIQDRQNLMSIFHDKVGLILGGGNTKLQPLWSSFTVGDTSLLSHKRGDTNPDFSPKIDLIHVPSAASLFYTDPVGLDLGYGGADCSVEVEPVDEKLMRITLKAGGSLKGPVAAHLTFLPRMKKQVTTKYGPKRILGKSEWTYAAQGDDDFISHGGWTLSLPRGATVSWPVLPHNPYRKDGSATPEEGRIVVSLPFSTSVRKHLLTLSVGR